MGVQEHTYVSCSELVNSIFACEHRLIFFCWLFVVSLYSIPGIHCSPSQSSARLGAYKYLQLVYITGYLHHPYVHRAFPVRGWLSNMDSKLLRLSALFSGYMHILSLSVYLTVHIYTRSENFKGTADTYAYVSQKG
jgi:hypothetical protein